MEEVWKDIPGFEGYYQASNLGRIKSLGTITKYRPQEKVLKLATTSLWYKRVHIGHAANRRTWGVHRLIAITFIPNPDNKPQVNHIDGNPSNNRVENLEWCTAKENIRHSYDKLGKKAHNCRKVRCIETGVVYDSTAEAGRALGLNCMHIAGCCRGDYGRHQVKGTHWKWAE